MGVKIEDLPLRLQAQVRAQLDNYAKLAVGRANVPELSPMPTPLSAADRGKRGHKVPNKTESDYQRQHLRGMDARYEALTFRMANGHRYTPDWVVFTATGKIECHEVKGGYALGSEQRARLAFDQARVEFPWIVWVWAKKTAGSWQIAVGRKENGHGMS